MKSAGVIVLLMIGLHSCLPKRDQQKTVDLATEKKALMDADEKFSDLSLEKGMKNAFIEYMDGDGVLLRPNKLPIIGATAIDYLIQQNDTSYKLHWKPQDAFVSKSADLGYTYGVYALQPNSQDTVIYGTYVSIWKKQEDGSWKFVLDTGNEGVDESMGE